MDRSNWLTRFLVFVAGALLGSSGAVADPLSTVFTYQGRLLSGGSPVNGPTDLTFRLFSVPTGGTMLAQQIFASVPVSNGLFTVELDFGAANFDGNDRWLEVVISGNVLSPRQPLRATPYALQTRGIFVDANKNVGIGTSSPAGLLDVAGGVLEVVIGTLPTSNCFVEHGSPGCDNADCQAAVCAADHFCCDIIWDGQCGGEAESLCTGSAVGVNTTAPNLPLTVKGSGANSDAIQLRNSTGQNQWHVNLNGGGLHMAETGVADFRLYLAPGGNVGIGTGTPNARLSLGTGNADEKLAVWDGGAGNTMGLGVGSGQFRLYLPNSTNRFSFLSAPNGSELVTINGTGNVGIGTNAPAQKLHVVGNICATGTIGACSDERFKTHIAPLDGALETVTKLRAVRFDWKRDEFPDQHFSNDRQLGLIAQEVQKVAPEVVQQGSDGYLSVDYGRLTPVLVEAIKELKRDNEELRARLSKLEHEVEATAAERNGGAR